MTRNKKRQRRMIVRNLALVALVVVIMIGGTCLVNILFPPVAL